MNGVTYGSGNGAPTGTIRRDCAMSREVSRSRHEAEWSRRQQKWDWIVRISLVGVVSLGLVVFLRFLALTFG